MKLCCLTNHALTISHSALGSSSRICTSQHVPCKHLGEEGVYPYLKPPQHGRHQLINLQQRDILPNTRPTPHPKLQHRPVHRLYPRLILRPPHLPPLRPVHIDILPKNILVPMQHPRRTPHDRAPRNLPAGNLNAPLGNNPLHRQPRRGMQPKRLLDAHIQVRQHRLAFVPRHQARLVVGELARARGVVDLFAQPCQRVRGFEQEIKHGRQRDGGGLGPGKGHRHGHGLDERVGHEVRAGLARGEELGEKVRGFDQGRLVLLFGGGEDGRRSAFLAGSFELGETLGHAGAREFGHGEGRVQEAPFGEFEVDGIRSVEGSDSGKGLGETNRRNVKEEFGQIRHDPIDILVPLDKPVPLAVRDLADDVERIKLQPPREIAGLRVVDVQALRLLEEETGGVVDERLILHQSRHGERRVDAAAELHVEVVVRGAEEGREAVAFDDGLLDDVEVGLGWGWSWCLLTVRKGGTHLDEALVQPVDGLEGLRV
jgi:hypothetical protein